MPATFTIPSIFTAIDKFTGPIKNMGRSVQAFASRAESGIARADRAFNKLTPAIGGAAKQFLSFASAAVVAGAIVAGVSFTAKQITDFEDALASFRTIVGGTDKEFKLYEQAALNVGRATRKSGVDVVRSFESIAGLNAEFAKTAESISAVGKANITLSKASRMGLDESAQNLVGIMNQFDLAAEESNRVINVLAAGQAVGAANIAQTSEAFKNFGSVAKGANITLEQSVGLIQTMGKFSVFGAEAGTKLRGSVLKLQQAGLGYKSGQFQMNDALEEARQKVDKLKTAKQKDAAVLKMFGAENISTGKILLANIDTINKYTQGVTGTDEAAKAAAINSATFNEKLKQLSATWSNIVLTSSKAGSSLSTANAVLEFLIVNLEVIVSWGTKLLIGLAAIKLSILLVKGALVAYNIVLGITGALSASASIAIGSNAVALGAYKTVLAIATAAQWAFNLAVTANPIGIIVVAIAGLIAFITLLIYKWDEWGATLSVFLGPLGMVISLVQSFRRNWEAIWDMFKSGNIVGAINRIGAALWDTILMPMQKLSEFLAELTGIKAYSNLAVAIEAARKSTGANTTTNAAGEKIGGVGEGTYVNDKPLINPRAESQNAMQSIISEKTNNAHVRLDINDPGALVKPISQDSDLLKINLSSTMGWTK